MVWCKGAALVWTEGLSVSLSSILVHLITVRWPLTLPSASKSYDASPLRTNLTIKYTLKIYF